MATATSPRARTMLFSCPVMNVFSPSRKVAKVGLDHNTWVCDWGGRTRAGLTGIGFVLPSATQRTQIPTCGASDDSKLLDRDLPPVCRRKLRGFDLGFPGLLRAERSQYE